MVSSSDPELRLAREQAAGRRLGGEPAAGLRLAREQAAGLRLGGEPAAGLRLAREQAAALVAGRAFGPVAQFLDHHAETLASAAAAVGLRGFSDLVRKENPDNFGLYLLRVDAPVPFLWFGLGWLADDPPDALPAWGASLEVNGPHAAGFRRGDGGLRAACESAAAASGGRLAVHDFGGHVELAEWRSMEWLLDAPDQAAALLGFWASYLERLAAGGVPAAVEPFVAACVAAPPSGVSR